jgi:hypothetical protein
VDSIVWTDQARTAFLELSLAQISSQKQQLAHQLAILRRLRYELDNENVLAGLPRKRRLVHDQILKIIDEAGAVSASERTRCFDPSPTPKVR